MEITKTIPAYNPADSNTLSGLVNVLQEKLLANIECAIPGIVESYDRNTNRAVIKPAITGVASQGQKVSKEPVINIPVFCMSGGGIIMSFPIREGDKGWLIANDRNISIFKQNLEESAPNDFRKHTFLDAFFLPDKINDINFNQEDDGAFIIQTVSGNTKISLKEGVINVNSSVINLNGNTVIDGSLTVSKEATIKGIPFTTHVHPNGNQGADTGVPK